MSVIGPRPQLVRDMVFMTKEQRMRHTAICFYYMFNQFGYVMVRKRQLRNGRNINRFTRIM